MANTLKFGNGEWYGKKDTILAYNDENSNFKPLPFSFERASSATVVNKEGLIETVGSGMPRIDYKDDSEGALLLEPQRSNLIPYSQDFSQSAWSKINATIEFNAAISPDGTLNASKIIDNSTNGYHRMTEAFSTPSSGNFTYSVFLKKGTLNTAQFQVFDGTTAASALVDLENGTIESDGQGINHKIENYGNGWYRCSVSGSYGGSTTTVYVYTKQKTPNYIGNGDYLYVWGTQFEEGSYATSYIPTSGSAVTRIADVCNGSGNDQVINSTEGVLYAEISALANDGTFRMISVSDGTNDNRVRINYTATNEQIQSRVYVGGAIVSSINKSNFTDITDLTKIALSYKQNEIKFYINGELIGTDTSATMPPADTFNVLNFDGSSGSNNFYGNVKDIRVYNTALTDQELKSLTQQE